MMALCVNHFFQCDYIDVLNNWTMMLTKSRDSFITNTIWACVFDVEHFYAWAPFNHSSYNTVVHPKINRWLNSQYFRQFSRSIVFCRFYCLLFRLLNLFIYINKTFLFYKYTYQKLLLTTICRVLSNFRFSCCYSYCYMSVHSHWSADFVVVIKKIYAQPMMMKYSSIK